MKKITLLFTTFLALQLGFSQQTISFEASEGYVAGDINGQNGWTTSGTGPGTFIENQIISAELATDGTNALKITKEEAFPGQSSPVVGAFYNYSAPISGVSAVFSADIYMSEQNAESSDYIFGLVNLTAGQFRTFVRFTFEGNVTVLVQDETNQVIAQDTNVDWSINTWYNVKIEMSDTNVAFSIDGVEIYSGLLATVGDVEQVRFSHDNFAGFAYIDNFRTNDEPTAGLDEYDSNAFNYTYNKSSSILTLDSANSPLDRVQLYNVLGQEVINEKLSQNRESLNLSNFENGIYIVKTTINNQVIESFKLMKQ